MNIFDHLARTYNKIDSDFAILELTSRTQGYTVKEKEFQRKRELNDMAYYLFMFTRLEDRVNELAKKLIERKKTTIWSQKRAWDLIDKNHKGDRLAFMDRVALLTERGNRNYNLIDSYYEQRNKIAHGKTFTIPISIPTVLVDFKRLYKDLR